MTRPIRQRFRARHIWLSLLLSAALSAQQNPDPQKPAELASPPAADNPVTTVFKSRSDLVLIPVVVRDHKGKHMPGLTKDQFRLEENGKEQKISLFEEILPSAAESATPPIDRGYTNLPFVNATQVRLTIIALDLLNTSQFQRADGRDQIVKFLSKGLAPNQPVSLACITSKGLRSVHPFSTDTAALIQALKKTPLGAETIMSGQAASTPPTYRENLVTSTIAQIREIAQAYVGIPGRKTLILAAGAIPQLATENQIFDASVLAGDLRQMWHTLIDANISIYTVHLMQWSQNPAARVGATGRLDLHLSQFSDSTGGNSCIEANDLMGCLASAVDDSRSYYMLGFSIEPDDHKPGWRSLKVKVSAEHASVRARDGFYYGAPPLEVPKRPQEINALASSVPQSAVPMYVKVLPSAPDSTPSPSGKKTIAFLMTVPLSSLQIDPSASNPLDLEVGAIALTSDTKEVAEFIQPIRGNPKPENLHQWAREGLTLPEKLDLPPGTYDVRFFARDNNSNQIGTVVFPLEVK